MASGSYSVQFDSIIIRFLQVEKLKDANDWEVATRVVGTVQNDPRFAGEQYDTEKVSERVSAIRAWQRGPGSASETQTGTHANWKKSWEESKARFSETAREWSANTKAEKGPTPTAGAGSTEPPVEERAPDFGSATVDERIRRETEARARQEA